LYRVLYDALDSNGHSAVEVSIVLLVVALVLMALGILDLRLASGIWLFRTWPRPLRSVLVLLISIAPLETSALMWFTYNISLNTIRAAENGGRAHIVKGGVVAYRPWAQHRAPAALTVDDTHFEFLGNVREDLLDASAPVDFHAGEHVRLTVVDGQIVKVEVRQ
jgi:hypothetical protein